MSKLVKNVKNGLYFVKGSGYTGTVKTATRFCSTEKANDQVVCAADHGITAAIETAPVSTSAFSVVYIRQSNLNADGITIRATRASEAWPFTPSQRVFATRAEAIQHGSRFHQRKAKGSDKPGTAGHIGYYVVESTKPVNAKVNWVSGLTNPI